MTFAKSFSLIAFSFASILTATAMAAETKLVLNSEVTRIQGLANQAAEVSAIAMYMPLYNYDKKLDGKVCKFAEDRFTMSGESRAITIKAERQDDGSYLLKVPTAGQRGACAYALDTVYFDVAVGKASQNLQLVTQRNVKLLHEALDDISAPEEVPALQSQTSLFCDSETEYDVGLCSLVTGDLPALYYQIDDAAASYTIDVKSLSERPERSF